MSLKTAKEKLLSFAISFNPEIKGVGQTPPTIYPPVPAGSLLLTPAGQTNKNIAPVSTNPSFQNLRLEDKRIVPYGTAHLFNHDIPSIVDLLSARKLEKQIDNLMLKTLYEIGEGSDKAAIIAEQITKTVKKKVLSGNLQNKLKNIDENKIKEKIKEELNKNKNKLKNKLKKLIK